MRILKLPVIPFVWYHVGRIISSLIIIDNVVAGILNRKFTFMSYWFCFYNSIGVPVYMLLKCLCSRFFTSFRFVDDPLTNQQAHLRIPIQSINHVSLGE